MIIKRYKIDGEGVWVPFASKKDIMLWVRTAPSISRSASNRSCMNSKCLRITLSRNGVAVQIEVKTSKEVPVSWVSNRELARRHGQPPRLIPVVDYPVALADNMAAWNERRLIRDLYDIWFYLRMGVRPDRATLEKRLDKPAYSRRLKATDHFKGKTMDEFFSFLRQAVLPLTDKDIEAELSDYLPSEEMVGLAMRFRVELAKLHGGVKAK